jgi:hypothetical protein
MQDAVREETKEGPERAKAKEARVLFALLLLRRGETQKQITI